MTTTERRELHQRRARTARERCIVEGAERRHFAVASELGIRVQTDYQAVEAQGLPAARAVREPRRYGSTNPCTCLRQRGIHDQAACFA